MTVWLLLLSLLGGDGSLAADEAQRIALIDRLKPAVVAVFGPSGQEGGGSAVLISPDGYALSNFHVVGLNVALRCGLNDGRLYPAVVVGLDPVGDVALLRLLGRTDFPAAPLGDSDKLQVGRTVLAMGNPFLLAADFEPTVTMGIVSGLHRYQYPDQTLFEYADCIQTDAAINPGNSGGPLFNSAGELVGVNGRASFEKRGRVSVGAAYAVSVNQIRRFLEHLKGGMLIDHGSLAATVAADETGRVVVERILNDADAYRQGLRPGDEILNVGGRSVGSVNQVQNVLATFPRYWRIELTYRRGAAVTTIRPRLEGVHRPGELLQKMLKTPFAERGIPPARLPPEVAAQYEAKEGFVNYYFNRRRRDDLLALVQTKVGSSLKSPRWRIEATNEKGVSARITLANPLAAWEEGANRFVLEAGESPNAEPPGTGGLLFALDQWRRLITVGAASFARCDFGGAAPAAREADPLLVLETDQRTGECRWLFDLKAGRLHALEWKVAGDGGIGAADLDDYKLVGGKMLPHRWRTRYDGRSNGEWRFRYLSLAE